jgi:hypothetical protein
MPSIPPHSLVLGCVRSLAVVACAAVIVSLAPPPSGASARPAAHATKRAKACKPRSRTASAATVAAARRTDGRVRASIARYSAHIVRLRRAGPRVDRAAVQRDQRAIARLRRQLSCQTRYVLANAGALRIGLNADTQGWGSQMGSRQDSVAPSGAKWLREQFDWSVVEPASGQYDWSRYDQLELTSAQRGFTVLPVLMHTPAWAGPNWNTIPSDPSAYADFVAHVVARYGPGGSFWAAHPDLASKAPQYFELWNEPYYPQFSAGQIDPGRYARLVKAGGQAGKAANRQAKFIAASETSVQPSGSSAWVSWTDAMYAAVPDLNNYFDAVAVHPYSKNRSPDAPINGYIHDKFQRIATIHGAFSDHGGADKPLWITEAGWSTCSNTSQDCVSEADQAAYTTKLFSMVQSQYRGFVAAVFLYRTSDLGPAGSSDAEQNFGLTRDNGAPKPAWNAVRAVTGA